MHKYKIKYTDIHNRILSEIVYAENEEVARSKLTTAVDILKISDKGRVVDSPSILRKLFHTDRVSHKELADILRNISYTRQSGLTIMDSITVLSSSGSTKQIMLCHALLISLREGASLADAFAKESHRLPVDISGIIAASSKAGTLNEVLISLADQLESSVSIANKVRSAMLYPCIILVIALVVAWFLFVNIIPQVATVIQSIGNVALPDSTVAILGMGSFLQTYGVWVIAGLSVFIFLVVVFFSRVAPRFKAKLALHMPIAGGIIRDSELIRFLNHFAFLIKAGFTVADAVDAATRVISNKYIANSLTESLIAIKEGYSLTPALAVSNVFTSIELQMLSVGDASGNIADVCTTLARQLSERSDRRLQDMIKLAEPAIMIIVGILVGIIMVAIYQPLFELMSIV